jgi:LysR family positive regulator for ilvC
MDLVELRAFAALAQCLHFAKAAAVVNLSPSALSRLLCRLEDELGTRLLERDTRQVSLTEAGLVFLDFARDTMHKRDEMVRHIAACDGRIRGVLRVFASVTACYSILPPFASALGREYPELRLTVETGDPAEAAPAMADARVDLALAALTPSGFPNHDQFSVQRTPLVFVAARQGPFGALLPENAANLTPATLGHLPLIIPRKGLARERLDRWMRKHALHPAIAAETAGNEAILALAHLGLGLGFVPRLVLENSPFAAGLIQYQLGQEFGDYNLGFVLSTRIPPAVDGVVRQLLAAAYPSGIWEKYGS